MSVPCLILAAGFGTRMGAMTADRPKPLIEVAGRTLLDHALDAARGTDPITVNAHYRADQIAAHLAGRDVHLQLETPEILDSGGSVKRAVQRWGEGPMATLNADNVWTGAPPIRQLEAAFDPARMGALLLLVPRADAVGRKGGGDFAMTPDGRIAFDKSADTYVYVGAQILDPAPCLNDPREVFSLRDVWQGYAEEGRLFGIVHEGRWADVGHPGGIEMAEEMLHVV
ncbi:nucleotidyltransferase family protein [Gymnodinialimonas ceratoperidinii]|uniref:Nucleotidyltransferase family protein n=1 Tax=Gymnodinialimonas ceratoperidinii TaxID=2856823 RepID=A0A8F6YAP9_9RHOB|nr:nucleotidyltransferase family protein [Gymnodinialimonas ceratoperidinii]QXT40164.1 nucleotidyltransferase family protein [Gymnodinialimonas ceratoperidinii]